ncbi:MAG: anthranilate synthase component I [Deltaproteobacteria bacterium]|nr:anthranilate synthase component I [Deltaproteobacteria bacterium]
MSLLSFKDFKKLAEEGNLVPLTATLNADTETPVSAFLKLTEGPYRFLLESMEGGEKWGRYSFLGSEPHLVLRSRGDRVEILRGKRVDRLQGNPLEVIRETLRGFQPVLTDDLPRFAGGFVGYLGYDMVRFMERLPDSGKKGLPLYDSHLMLQDSLVAFDNLKHELKLVVMAHLGGKNTTKKAYDLALRRLNAIGARMKRNLPKEKALRSKAPVKPKSNTSEKAFHAMVERAKEYIRAGDIFQVVLSQRWEAAFKASPFRVYRELRKLNPSPYLFHLEMNGQCLSGSSPEVMVRLEGSKVTVRPIAGTRRRGRDAADESRMEKEMLDDPKEVAEHIMLVDLGRNDVGRVSKKGSVKVTELMAVEKYSHVMHLVSNVEGELDPSFAAIDVLKATFPAGTLSGAPKIRAMQVIEELEVGRRGPYGGAVGYFDFYGNMDTAITIRHMAFAEGKVWVQSGGGIVLDSKPELEYLESNNKAKAVMEALKRCS